MILSDSQKKLEYISSGIFKSNGEWIHPRRTIDSFEVIFVYNGTAYITEENEEYILNSNDVLILEPEKEHFGSMVSVEPVSFFWFHYNTTDEKYTNIPKHFNIMYSFHLRTLFSQLLHIANTPDYNQSCTDLFAALILEEILYQNRTVSNSGNSLAVQIKEWIRVNIDTNITVRKTAEHFGYHENYIGKVFKNAFNTGIKEYISDLKLKSAKNLLTTSLYTIKQISYLIGFESENHFIKFFKYHEKMTPTEYRNIYTNTHINKK